MTPTTSTAEWRGRVIEINYNPQWVARSEAWPSYDIAHLEIRVVEPERAPLPVTETGYRSCFPEPEVVAAAGGPVAWVLGWLDAEAQGKRWAAIEAKFNQLDLFS